MDKKFDFTDADSPIERLSAEDCWGYLNRNSFGRLAVVGNGGVDIFPINYMTYQSTVLFRSAPGIKLIDITKSPDVAFEIDGFEDNQAWSVVLRGTANRIGSDQVIQASAINKLSTDIPTDKWNYVQIAPRTITGRRFARTS